jgi:hypothetical protein
MEHILIGFFLSVGSERFSLRQPSELLGFLKERIDYRLLTLSLSLISFFSFHTNNEKDIPKCLLRHIDI